MTLNYIKYMNSTLEPTLLKSCSLTSPPAKMLQAIGPLQCTHFLPPWIAWDAGLGPSHVGTRKGIAPIAGHVPWETNMHLDPSACWSQLILRDTPRSARPSKPDLPEVHAE